MFCLFSASRCLRFLLLQITSKQAIKRTPRIAMPMARPIFAPLGRPVVVVAGLSTSTAVCAFDEAVDVGVGGADVT